MQIEVVRPRDLSPRVLDIWSELTAASPELDSPFLGPGWARAVETAQGDAVDRMRVAVIRDEAGEPVGFFPAKVGPFTAMAAGAPMSDYQGLVARPGVKVDPRALVQALGVSRFDFCHMLESQAMFAPHAKGRDTSWMIGVPDGYAVYEAERRAAGVGILKDLDKKRRKVEREIAAPVFTAFSRSQTDMDQLIVWKRAQMKATGQTDLFDTRWVTRLLQDLFESRDPDFGGVLFTLHIGDKLAATHLHLRGRRTIHGWMIAYDPAFERYSPGLLLFQDILRWMDDTPYDRLDLGSGDYRFKRELSNLQQGVTFGFVGTPSAATLMRQAAYGVRRAAETLPLGRMSAIPGKAMRRIDVLRGLR